jgi:uncharacterized protein (TIGR03000 family)
MTRKFTYKLAASALSLAVLAASASDAFAGWRWHGSSGGSSGGYGSSGGWGGGSSGGWGGSSGGWGGGSSGGWGGGSSGGWGGGSSGGWGGSSGGWGGWKHSRHHRWFRGHGSSGGGSSGGWGGSSGGWGSSGGGSSGGTYYYPGEWEGKSFDPSTAPTVDPMTPSGEAPPAVPGTPRDTSYRRADGLLSVNVPADAKVFVNGLATTSTGGERQYVSRDLQSGFNYTYEVKAEIVRDGKTVEQVKQVNLRAGQTAELAFDFPAAEQSATAQLATAELETSLTVHVPAGAKVYLAGNPTKAQGETRVFRTTGLSSGKNWNDYTVRVELEQEGRIVTKEKTISLKAGESQELTFDFEGDRVAAAR